VRNAAGVGRLDFPRLFLTSVPPLSSIEQQKGLGRSIRIAGDLRASECSMLVTPRSSRQPSTGQTRARGYAPGNRTSTSEPLNLSRIHTERCGKSGKRERAAATGRKSDASGLEKKKNGL
jgi:hypothetical protein